MVTRRSTLCTRGQPACSPQREGWAPPSNGLSTRRRYFSLATPHHGPICHLLDREAAGIPSRPCVLCKTEPLEGSACAN